MIFLFSEQFMLIGFKCIRVSIEPSPNGLFVASHFNLILLPHSMNLAFQKLIFQVCHSGHRYFLKHLSFT